MLILDSGCSATGAVLSCEAFSPFGTGAAQENAVVAQATVRTSNVNLRIILSLTFGLAVTFHQSLPSLEHAEER